MGGPGEPETVGNWVSKRAYTIEATVLTTYGRQSNRSKICMLILGLWFGTYLASFLHLSLPNSLDVIFGSSSDFQT